MILPRGPRGDEIDSRIRDALLELRPLLHIQEATVELVQFEEETGTAVLRVEGECPDCEMSAANLIEGIGACRGKKSRKLEAGGGLRLAAAGRFRRFRVTRC